MVQWSGCDDQHVRRSIGASEVGCSVESGLNVEGLTRQWISQLTSTNSFLGLFPCELKNWVILKQTTAGSFVHSYAAVWLRDSTAPAK